MRSPPAETPTVPDASERKSSFACAICAINGSTGGASKGSGVRQICGQRAGAAKGHGQMAPAQPRSSKKEQASEASVSS